MSVIMIVLVILCLCFAGLFFAPPKLPKQHRILAYDRSGSPVYMKSTIERLA